MISREAIRLNRSRVVDEELKRVINGRDRAQIKRLLKEGAQERAARDLALAKEWFGVDEQAWQGRRT